MSTNKMTYAKALCAKLVDSKLVDLEPEPVAVTQKPSKPVKYMWRYGRYRPNGKFDNSHEESEARSEWIESQKDRGRNRD